MEKRKREPRPKLYEEEVVHIGRVTKVTSGGRHFRFSATVVVGKVVSDMDLAKLMKYLMLLKKLVKMQLNM